MLRIITAGTICCAVSISAIAQDNNLVGKWSGSHDAKQSKANFELNITSVENGVVKGNAKWYRPTCRGDYEMQGKLDGNELRIRSTNKGGPTGDCTFAFRATVDGNRMTGKIGPRDLSAQKQ